jgi:hypothetical protein
LLHALLITYSLGGKYQEAINVWEAQQNTTHLDDPDLARDCIGLLYEAYTHINQPQKAEELLKVLPASDVLTTALPLFGLITTNTESSLVSAPAVAAAVNATARDEAKAMAEAYLQSRKDPTTARVLNAVLPGSGYLYVGQYQTAATSLAINALFIAATWQLFAFHQPAAGCIAGSLEGGWYLGGIVGAGLSADLYNQRLREQLGRPYLERFSLFPLRLLRYGW